MTSSEYEGALSPARLNRYVAAVGGDTTKAITLYRLNIQLSQRFYGMLSVFEVCLRNRIDMHYTAHFADMEWLKNQCTGTGFLANPAFKAGGFKSRKNVDGAIRSLGVKYTHDRLVASMTLGFWVNLFAPLQFRLAGQTLHRCFMARPKGTRPKDLYNQLDELLRFRNRIAHAEPICFDVAHQKDTTYAQGIDQLLHSLTQWLGFDPIALYQDIGDVSGIVGQIDGL
jgi:hypothetical protein